MNEIGMILLRRASAMIGNAQKPLDLKRALGELDHLLHIAKTCLYAKINGSPTDCGETESNDALMTAVMNVQDSMELLAFIRFLETTVSYGVAKMDGRYFLDRM